MAALVIGDQLNLFLRAVLGSPLWAHGDFVLGVFQLCLGDEALCPPVRLAGRLLINQICQICA